MYLVKDKNTISALGEETYDVTPNAAYIIPDVLYPAVAGKLLDGSTATSAVTTGPNGSTVASSKYGTVQSDGRMYYYTDIKGSKPIKDPRIGAHFGSQRYKCKSMQLLDKETASHGELVYSLDGREWMRVVDLKSANGPVYMTNGDGGLSTYHSNAVNAFYEITGYFNNFNVGVRGKTNRVDDVNVTINGGTTRNSSATDKLGGKVTVNTPLGARFLDEASFINHEDSNVTSDLGATPAINTLRFEPVVASGEYFQLFAIELIAHNTTSTATKSQIQIPSQNVVSYGKKFTVAAAAHHYNPFAFKTDGSTAWASGAHNGTSWPIGTGSSTNIDTATSLGLEAWLHSSNYYKPYNGGRVVKWIDSEGTIRTSVNVMPPNARSIEAGAHSAKANASVANNTYLPTFDGSAVDNSQAELAKTFHWREFGNGAGNGGHLGGTADASMLNNPDLISYVMDDGLTGIYGDAVEGYDTDKAIIPTGTNNYIFFTFIGTGISFENISTVIAQNLSYGTHVFKSKRLSTGHELYTIDGVEITTALSSIGKLNMNVSFYQPKMPPIPENAIIISDYMLMAEHVNNTVNGSKFIAKGVRTCSQSRDIRFEEASGGFVTSYYDSGGHPGMGYQASSSSSGSATSNEYSLPAFGTAFGTNGHTSENLNDLFIDDVDVSQSGTSDGNHGDISYTASDVVTLGMHKFAVHGKSGQSYSPYISGVGYKIATPTHTSSHYQAFETPFLHELVGGDRNMEQTNLVVTPDGKTWDEVTRDTSYIGTCSLLRGTDSSFNNSTFIIFDDNRGVIPNRGDAIQKDFAIAYDRDICLRTGQYAIHAKTMNQVAGDAAAMVHIYVNGTLTCTGHGTSSGHSDSHTMSCGQLQRGDYVQIKGTWYPNHPIGNYWIERI